MNMEKISSSLVMHLKCITLLGDHHENDLLLNIGSAKIFDVMKNEVNQWIDNCAALDNVDRDGPE